MQCGHLASLGPGSELVVGEVLAEWGLELLLGQALDLDPEDAGAHALLVRQLEELVHRLELFAVQSLGQVRVVNAERGAEGG